ncbi:hypothetical protein [Litoribacter populi]|uniref:hypothetical protein n=1 Tax=Litoribacter populi TaxID=2598460 RepID=UPI00117CE975|nr:hypothetical protein [Litoribacter populi]
MIQKILFIAICFLRVGAIQAQTFTYNSDNAGCNGQLGTNACWTVSDNCTGSNVNNTSLPLSLASFQKSTGCPINLVFENGDLDINNHVTLGKAIQSVTVNTGSVLNISGNLVISGENQLNIITNGGRVNVGQDLIMSSGKNGTETKLFVSGNGLGSFNVSNDIDLNNRSELHILEGGRLISAGDTEYNGTDIDIFVNKGFFRTGSLTISGNENKLNIANNGIVVIDGDVKFRGNDAGLVIGGDSEMEIGGDIDVSNNSSFQIDPGSQVRMCGNNVSIPDKYKDDIISDGDCFYILPVEWHQVSAKFQTTSRLNTVNWSTLKEWENSHFEIERSIGGVKNYEMIGRVEGMGWTDEMTEYSFCDDNLPLRGERIYYRIKQVDFDGTFDYSQTMMVNVPGMQVTKGDWRAYPNPVRGIEFNIARLAEEPLNSNIQVKILTSQIPVASFIVKDEGELNSHLRKLLPRIPQGVFVVELQSNKQVEYLKVIKE